MVIVCFNFIMTGHFLCITNCTKYPWCCCEVHYFTCLFFHWVFLISVTISANGTIQLATPGSEGLQGLQTVTTGGAQQGTTVLQYAQTPDGQQILVPSNQVVVQGQSTMKCSLEQKLINGKNRSAEF